MLRLALQVKCIGAVGGTVDIWDHGPQAYCCVMGKSNCIYFRTRQNFLSLSVGMCPHEGQ